MIDDMMSIEGKWINKHTNAIVNVKNAIIDENEMIIITDKGQISGSEFSKNYLQVSDEIYDSSGKVIDTQPNQNINNNANSDINIVPLNEQEYDFIDNDIPSLTQHTNNRNQEISTNNSTIVSSNNNSINNEHIIRKVFDKLEAKPNIKIDIEWANFPKEQISTLVNYLDVDISDIALYMYKEFINDEFVKKTICEIIRSHITNTEK